MHWEHEYLGAQAGLLGFSLCLKLVAHRTHGTRDSTEAHLSREARSEVIGHVAVLESTSTGK
jgi:hypothetical protein